MKKLLIFINCVLIVLLGLSLWGAFAGKKTAPAAPAVKRTSRNSDVAEKTAAPAVGNAVKWPSSSESASIIAGKNVFNPQRGGLTGGRGVITYSLVGIFKVGNVQGAIILTKGGPGGSQVKQRFMLGDTLPNGYTLEQVQTNQVVLVNGSSKMVLTQALPSENFPSSGGRRRQPNQMQQMLDLMRQSVRSQQMQNMNMMQMMRNNQGNMPQRGGSTNGRRR